MARKCAVCCLEADLLTTADQQITAGVTTRELLGWLEAQGAGHITSSMVENHKRHARQKQPLKGSKMLEDAPTPYLSEPGLSSSEALYRAVQATLEQADRLRSFCNGADSLRAERSLSEVLERAFRMLSEVEYDARD
ncbi:hypothetical protein H6F90_21940 [Trichocoleus sp. FACHB-591]|uniref:hypothetical protein n=1 Tax=Trichocoleus sp. FACHB-591 TaxID=2692872 RepID=UPI0016847C46|nr:hypothetical protein [Trichocoleus sp. FACHB-591]MBD2097738.1 hypothetical protein [Trichocoleus sp. FACHB-591]